MVEATEWLPHAKRAALMQHSYSAESGSGVAAISLA
jgi:hypothetical protein